MPRLPTAADLGGLPSPASGRAVASYDVSGLARGGAAIAAGVQQLGKGASEVGADVGGLAQKFQEDAYINATANRNARFAELHTSLQNDKGYATLEDRYRKSGQKIVDEEAINVPAGRLRRHFEATSAELQATGAGHINRQAFAGLASSDADRREAELTRIQKDIRENPDNPARKADIDGYNLRVDAAVRQKFATKEQGDLEKLKAHDVTEKARAGVMVTREPLRFLRETDGLPRGEEAMPAYWDRGAARRASGVNQDLMSVVKRASEISGTQFTIGDKGGTRDQATQDQLVAEGRSQTRNSNHLTGGAIDLIPIVNGKANPDAAPEHFAEINRAMTQAKQELGLDVKWGGEWKGFKDVAHYELPKGSAPAGPVRFATLDPDTLRRYQREARATLHARDVDLQQQARLAETQRKQFLTDIEDEYLKDSYGPNPTKTAVDAASDTRLDGEPEAKKKIIAVMDRANKPDPIARVSQSTTADFLGRMRLPEGDSRKLTDAGEIDRSYIDGKMTRADRDWAVKQFTDARSPGTEALSKTRDEFFKKYAPTIDPGMELGMHSALGGQNMYRAEKDARGQEEALRKAGKDPQEVYDPRSPNFFGDPKNISRYRPTLQQAAEFRAQQKADEAGKPAPAAAPQPAAKPAEVKPPIEGARMAPDGNWYVEKGSKFFLVVPKQAPEIPKPERHSEIMSDENPDAIVPGGQYAANLIPLKGSTEAVRPGRVIGEGGGGGGGARIDFKSSGAQRGESTGARTTRSLSDLTEEELAASKANSSAYQARLKERLDAISKTKEGREAIADHAKKIEDADRIDFKSSGAAKKP